jgi:hypothetical protein
MVKEEIESLCESPQKKIKSLHWQGTYYGIGKWIKDYGFFPQSLTLPVLTDHSGPSTNDHVPITEQRLRTYAVLKSSPRVVKLYQKIYGSKCHVILSPNVYYRRKKNITKSKKARGTLVFAAHTTEHIENASSIDAYIQSLKELPQQYQPITICIHPIDVNKGLHLKYNRHFEVVSAGHHQHPNFIERFYAILSKYQYTSSNMIGSYALYAAEMGIPFFLHGDRPELINKSDPTLSPGKMKVGESSDTNKYAYQLFSERVDEVTRAQKSFVEYELGITEGCSRMRLSLVLWKAYMKYVLDAKLKRRIKKALKTLVSHD